MLPVTTMKCRKFSMTGFKGGVKTERVFPGLSVLRKNNKMEVLSPEKMEVLSPEK
jgi:hypothetical protein